jgi:hypothetical protein
MGAFNTVETRLTCPSCACELNINVQFKYGHSRQYAYHIGDVLYWHPLGNADDGTPGHRKVVVHGVTDCPVCGNELEFEVWLENDRIVAVKLATGAYDFVAARDTYIVVEE